MRLPCTKGEHGIVLTLEQIKQALLHILWHVCVQELRHTHAFALEYGTNKILQRAVSGGHYAMTLQMLQGFTQQIDRLCRYCCSTQQAVRQFCRGGGVKSSVATKFKDGLLNSCTCF